MRIVGDPNILFSCRARKSNILKLFTNRNTVGKIKQRLTEFWFPNLKHCLSFDALLYRL